MNDIVDRLRDVAGFIQKEHGRVAAAACLATEAADLIQSLREKTQYWPDNAERDAVIRYQKEEIERLRARLEIDPSHPYDGIYARDETIRQQDKQIDRLRAALGRIVKLDDEWVPQTQDDYSYTGYQVCGEIARAALEAK